MKLEHFVTLFDSLFLPQGLALHASMQRNIANFSLWVLCVDDQVYEILHTFALPNVRLLKLSLLETADLARVKLDRTKGEYCWTLTPFAPRFVFEADASVNRVSYIDADLWFRKDPLKIFQELDAAGKAVLITEHGYAAEYDQSATSGRFCVQFIVFSREGGEPVRQWWEDRCIEWCYARFEDGKFGDQLYLDLWPDIFGDKVHVLRDKELALAPWNATRFPYGNSVFYHFHGLRIINENQLSYGDYLLPPNLIRYVYQPYLIDLKAATERMRTFGVKLRIQAKGSIWLKVIASRILTMSLGLVRSNTIRW